MYQSITSSVKYTQNAVAGRPYASTSHPRTPPSHPSRSLLLPHVLQPPTRTSRYPRSCNPHLFTYNASRCTSPVNRGSVVPAAFAAEPSISSYEDDSTMSITGTFASEIYRLQTLRASLQRLTSWDAKVWRLHEESVVSEFFRTRSDLKVAIEQLPTEEQYALTCTVAIGQEHALVLVPESGHSIAAALSELAQLLVRVERFYDSMGGIIGYQLKSLQLISDSTNSEKLQQGLDRLCRDEPVCYLVPPGLDMIGPDGDAVARHAAADGLDALPSMAEIYPVGGAGDRLGLKCEITGESLPAALLQFGGHTMLENLLRDLQAREYLYFKLTGRQVTTPVAIMTSDAKGNHMRISNLLESLNWVGRDKDSFRLFRQPLVPVLCVDDGKWLLKGPLRLMMKPGGHGVIWKLMRDEGVFDWLLQQKKQAAILRQVSNPMAGVDTTLLALAGVGHRGGKVFGFMSCERAVGASEGLNVLVERRRLSLDQESPTGYSTRYNYGVSNIEYTEFERLGISDEGREGAANTSVFPANTNILYVGLPQLSNMVTRCCNQGGQSMLPGLIFNMKKKVLYSDPVKGTKEPVRAGRMECTMQNAADWFTDTFSGPLTPEQIPQLSTFIVQNLRSKVTSSAKKKRESGSSRIRQTPDGALYDWIGNTWQLLRSCNMEVVPEVRPVDEYLAYGPDFLFFFHPALGPMWDVIAQKIRGGSLARHSELLLEVAEADLENVHIKGSLLVKATQVMGHFCSATESSSSRSQSASQPTSPHSNPLSPSVSPASPTSLSSPLSSPPPHIPDLSNGVHEAAGRSDSIPAHSSVHAGGISGRVESVISTADCGDHVESIANGARLASRPQVVYSSRCGRIRLVNVRVENEGVDWGCLGNVFWKHQVERLEAVQITLNGHSEFHAKDVTLTGRHTFNVPDGHRMCVTAESATGAIITELQALQNDQPSWEWVYHRREGGEVVLTRQEHCAA